MNGIDSTYPKSDEIKRRNKNKKPKIKEKESREKDGKIKKKGGSRRKVRVYTGGDEKRWDGAWKLCLWSAASKLSFKTLNFRFADWERASGPT